MPTRIIRKSDGKMGTLADGYPMPEGFAPVSKFTAAIADYGPKDPAEVLSPLYKGAGKALSQGPLKWAGQADVAMGLKTPEQAASRGEMYGNLLRDVILQRLMGGVKNPVGQSGPVNSPLGFMGRTAQQGALAAGEEAAQSGKMEKGPMAMAGGVGAGFNLLGEGATAIPRGIAAARAGKTAKQAYEAMTKEVPERAAATLMNYYTKAVPAWKDYPRTVEGLKNILLGDGPKRLHNDFKMAFDAAIPKAQGVGIPLSEEFAKKLGLRLENGMVNAADAMQAVTGMSLKAPAAYRAVADALDQKGLIDKAAYQAYKEGQSLIGMAKSSKGLFKGGEFHPDKFVAAMEQPSVVQKELGRRGVGNYYEGPFADMRNLPQPEQGFSQIPNPLHGHPWMGMMAGGAATGKIPGLSIPGELAGLALAQKPSFGSYAPLSRPTLDTLGGLSGMLGTMGREYAAPPGSMSPQNPEDAFQQWYKGWAAKAGINPNPYDPLHHYDYKAAYNAGAVPAISPEDNRYHWPSQFKAPDHPNRYVNGIDTITGQPIQ